MHQQHDLDGPRHESPSAGHPFDALDTRSAIPSPAPAPAPQSAQPHAASRPSGRPSLAELGGLTHLLVAPIATERAITVAVERAAQLIPAARRLALYALDPAVPDRLLRLVAAKRERVGALPQLSTAPASARTLGHGERADRQVLVERGAVWLASAALLPLSGAGDALLGALVVEHLPDATRPDATLLSLIADLLAALLARRAADEAHRRALPALDALPALAFAPETNRDVAASAQEPAADQAAAAATEGSERHTLADVEEVAALLNAGAQELRALAAAHDAIALVRLPSGAWTALPSEHHLPGDIGITPAQAEALLPALRAGPVTIAPGQDDMLWSELAPLRQQGGYPNARVHLIAAASPAATYAIYALAEGPATPPLPVWLPLARALATAVAAGIAARGLAEEARDEARARDAYMSLVAHELRSPLTAIKGYAQLLLRQSHRQPLPEPILRSAEAIEQQSLRLAEMLGELLDASRLRRGTLRLVPAPVDLGAILREVVERRGAMYPQHAITLDLPPEPLTVTGEAARIEQVLRDLIDNAARHSPGGGAITVGVTTPQAGEDEGMALVTVRDSGVGIAANDRERIFEYLYRAPRSMERNLAGLGLGLYVSRHLVERIGGRLWLAASSTDPPTGSELRFTLPLA